MRRVITIMLALLLIVSAGVPTAFAAHQANGHHRRNTCVNNGICDGTGAGKGNGTGFCANKCNFTDADGDGICDNCKNVCGNCKGNKDENGDGICDDCGACCHFVDENGDGVCDNCGKKPAAGTNPAGGNPNGGSKKHHNSGSHHGGGHRRHQ